MTEEEIQARIAAAVEAERASAAAATATAVAEATAAATESASAAASEAERARIAGIHANTLPGYEAERDEAIQTGSTPDAFAALIVQAEKAKGAQRAKAINEDEAANAAVKPAIVTPTAKGDAAAVSAILAATAAARGSK